MKRTLTAVAALFAAGSVQAADLFSIYQEALAKDARYQAARAAYQAAQERLPQGRAGLLPQASFGYSRDYNDVDNSLRGRDSYTSDQWNVTASQPLFRMQNFVAYEQAKIQVEQAESQFATATQDLIFRVSQSYFDILLARVNVELAGAQKRAIGEQLEQAKRNFEVGTATIVDTYEAQARFDLTNAQEIAARNQLEIARRALQQIIGRFPDELQRARSETFQLFEPDPPRMEDWIAIGEKNSLELKTQQAAYDLASKEVDRARAGHYPTVDLVASYTDASNVGSGVSVTGTGIDSKSTQVGVQVAVPIFEGFATQSRVREALSNQDRALQDLDNVRRTITQRVQEAYLNVTNGIARVKAFEQSMVSSQSQLDSTKLGQEVGVRTQVDVLNATQQLTTARRDYFQAVYDYVIAYLRLQQAAGVLTEEDVVAINKFLY
ncbi:MAG TPA: TolC family outer membrane protein [Pelomicrobium sp.]|nr:TolC family outer membrane protein [Pelomicrobium sp.]